MSRQLAFTTGMRRGELTFNEPKTEKGWRQIPVNEDTLRVLIERRKIYFLEEGCSAPETWGGQGLIFGTVDDTPISPSNLDRDWKAVIKESGLPPITLHALRHIHATMLIANGIDVRHLADCLGHSRPSFTLDTYAHVYASHREKAALTLDQLLGDSGSRG
ncbi:hypothetical protein GCM10008955_15370 [Deinococcus malanensis]|uniref:Tyr recombinase domain-containing protein n=1 Tax=Deinococcus malanensis TaxID=1706855 RepID=A0ABQ2ESG3_9DEIO|nr:site-specific integrase [Deinococcus malanensis]GGK22821.1 hypothetical protein GCM10008955_15370 [Deinococcus malanensis]